MANNYTKNPMEIDTITTSPVNTTTLYIIKNVEWISPSSVGNVASLQDKDGNQLVYFTCVTANQNMIKYFEPPEPVYGLHIPKLDSGKLLITRV
ncbi:MAG: hypothetical protein QXQ53_01125 [Candidatus Methanosuratincola sp.]